MSLGKHSPAAGGGGAHPDLATHDTLGLATQAELDGHTHAAAVVDRNASLYGTFATLTNQPAAAREFGGTNRHRLKLDLTGRTQIAFGLRVRTAGVAGSVCYIEYSTDDTTFAFPDDTTLDGCSLSLATVGTKRSTWRDLVVAARADVYVRAMDGGGDAVADPEVANLIVWYR